MDIIEKVCAAYSWQRALGHEGAADLLCRVVRDPEHPNVWDANHVSEVRARNAVEIEQVFRRAERALAHCRQLLFAVDPLTPAQFVARLALDDYSELTPTIQLVLDGDLHRAPRAVETRSVTNPDDWDALAALVREDHVEGTRTGGPLADEVSRGLVATYHKKWPVYQFFIATESGVDCAYGASVLCENGIGMVEDLFTRPTHRRKGIATGLIARAIKHARERGAEQILIGARTTDRPKQLYASLGFTPVCVTRQYIKAIARP
jgi:GNAT superfamily N-acetyltransferase